MDISNSRRNGTYSLSAIVELMKVRGFPPVMSQCQVTLDWQWHWSQSRKGFRSLLIRPQFRFDRHGGQTLAKVKYHNPWKWQGCWEDTCTLKEHWQRWNMAMRGLLKSCLHQEVSHTSSELREYMEAAIHNLNKTEVFEVASPSYVNPIEMQRLDVYCG